MALCAHYEIATLDFALVLEQVSDLARLGRAERSEDAREHEQNVRDGRRPTKYHEGREL